MRLHVNDWVESSPTPPELLGLLQQAGERVIALLGRPNDEAGLTLVDDATIREYNRDHRGIDAPTDVLSFALDEGAENDPAFDAETGVPHLVGDILISMERAAAQSRDYGHSLEREVVYLMVHGLLHLYGFDHGTDEERAEMRGREEAVMTELGLGRD